VGFLFAPTDRLLNEAACHRSLDRAENFKRLHYPLSREIDAEHADVFNPQIKQIYADYFTSTQAFI
jgi:hypothetical protein